MDGHFSSDGRPQIAAEAALLVGQVTEIDGSTPVILIDERLERGRRAPSCLIEPMAGDTVLVVGVDGEAIVLAVLSRTADAPAVLSVPGTDAVTLSQPQLAVRCETLEMDADRTTLRSRVAQVAGRTLNAVAERLDVVARTLRRSADHEFSHAKTASRTVEGTETVTAGEMMLEARSALTQRAGIVLVDAREDVRVNGERITMG
ncbi:hypothetical protein BAL199_01374 [alpha proteobacterium BAL199]|jgi:hypothetical protein|nr:hypothetical protein BAL199_01374 [alpha proteobacterium BAL199]